MELVFVKFARAEMAEAKRYYEQQQRAQEPQAPYGDKP